MNLNRNQSATVSLDLLPSCEEGPGEVDLKKFPLTPSPSPLRERGAKKVTE